LDHTPFLKIVVQGKGHMGNRVAFVFVEVNMAEKKKKTTKKVTYRDKKFTIMEEVNGRLKLTDGIIHFWVKADKVERN
jgi:RNA binding exosome subunit